MAFAIYFSLISSRAGEELGVEIEEKVEVSWHHSVFPDTQGEFSEFPLSQRK